MKEKKLPTYREILSTVIEKTSPSFFETQSMPRNLMLNHLVPEQTGVTFTQAESNQFAQIFQKMIDRIALTAAEDAMLDVEKT